jgi:hypothetical protein
MTSLAQTKANQRNAKKSTGPKTPAGKAKVSQNALTHGIYASIPLLPGENQDKLSQLADDINAAFEPTDAMEVSIVERIIIGTIRQIRLREAEAAKLRISMSQDAIADRMGSVIRQPLGRRFYAEELSDQAEVNYEYYDIVLQEINHYQLDKNLPSLMDIQNNAPNTWGCLDMKATEYGYSWEDFTKDTKIIKRAIAEIKTFSENFIKANAHNHKAYQLKGDMEIASRIPQGDDMALFSKYQIQLDTDIYRAMDALRKYRQDKAKIIEAEVINE